MSGTKTAMNTMRKSTGSKRTVSAKSSSRSNAASREKARPSLPKTVGFAVCVAEETDGVSVIKGKVYRVVEPDPHDFPYWIRVVDETGEDYPYNVKDFATFPVTSSLKRRLLLVTSQN